MRKFISNALKGISLTSALFVFQACYGTPEDLGFDIKLTGTVKSKTTHLPIKGIKVSTNKYNYGITDEKGHFEFYTYIEFYDGSMETYRSDSIPVHFLDIDGAENGYFQDREMIINPMEQDEVKINIELEEKNEN